MIIKLVNKIYDETRDFNLEMQRKIPELKDFRWEPFKRISNAIFTEYVQWAKHLLLLEDFQFTPQQRHAFAVANRISHGWQLGEKRNDLYKIDPYLIPFDSCPDWLQEWCIGKDKIMIEGCQEYFI